MLQNKQKILEEVGLSRDSFDNVSITKQETETVNRLTENLDISFNRTTANTLDITTYFKDTKNESKSENSFDESDIFDDGLDDILGNLDV